MMIWALRLLLLDLVSQRNLGASDSAVILVKSTAGMENHKLSVANKPTAGWLLESLRAICGEDPLKHRASWLLHLVHGEKLWEKQG